MSKNTIVTPIPGMFYRKPSPTEDFYAEKGQFVKTGDTIGLIEVMKNFFEIKAEEDGILVDFLAESEEFVEAGQSVAIIEIEAGDKL